MFPCVRKVFLFWLVLFRNEVNCFVFKVDNASNRRQKISTTTSADSRGALLAGIDPNNLGSLLIDTTTGKNDVAKVAVAAAAPLALFFASSRPPASLIPSTKIESVLEGTFLGRAKNVRCVYKASRDGWSAVDFHEAVDEKGSGLVVCRTLTGKLFGAYNPVGWRSSDDYSSSTAAFLFAFGRNNDVLKFPVYAGGDGAIYDYATGGPCFGAADLLIGKPRAPVLGGFAGPDQEDVSINAGNLRQGKSSIGGTYKYEPGWPVAGPFQLSEVEVYCNVA